MPSAPRPDPALDSLARLVERLSADPRYLAAHLSALAPLLLPLPPGRRLPLLICRAPRAASWVADCAELAAFAGLDPAALSAALSGRPRTAA